MSVDLLLDLAWKSGLVAAAALAAGAVAGGRPAAERVMVLRLGLVLIFVLPLLSMALPRMNMAHALHTVPPPATVEAAPSVRLPASETPLSVTPSPVVAQRPTSPALPAAAVPIPDLKSTLILLYGLGVAFLLARLVLGLGMLARWTSAADTVSDPAWRAALARAARDGPRPRLKVTARLSAPLSWGLRPAVVLIPQSALARPEQAAAVLEHELAHIRRGDWTVLILSRLAVALLWFNPLVWLLQRELLRQSERAADEHALRRVNRTDYAQTLVLMAGGSTAHAGMGMAGSGRELAHRVRSALSDRRRQGAPWITALAAMACAAFAAPLAALEMRPSPPPSPTMLPSPAAPPSVVIGPRASPDIAPVAIPDTAADSLPETPPRIAGGQASAPPNTPAADDDIARHEAEARRLRALAAAPGLSDDERDALLDEAHDVDESARDLLHDILTAQRDQAEAEAEERAAERDMAAVGQNGRPNAGRQGARQEEELARQMQASVRAEINAQFNALIRSGADIAPPRQPASPG